MGTVSHRLFTPKHDFVGILTKKKDGGDIGVGFKN
jgi:hypothetical protein